MVYVKNMNLFQYQVNALFFKAYSRKIICGTSWIWIDKETGFDAVIRSKFKADNLY